MSDVKFAAIADAIEAIGAAVNFREESQVIAVTKCVAVIRTPEESTASDDSVAGQPGDAPTAILPAVPANV